MGSCNVNDLVFYRWLYHRIYRHWPWMFKALTGIQEFPELKLDSGIGLNYQDRIEEVLWLQVAEEGDSTSTCEIFVEREGRSGKHFLGSEIDEENQNCSL
jgi:hypothetical protein